MTTWQLYLILKLDTARNLFGMIGALLLILTVVRGLIKYGAGQAEDAIDEDNTPKFVAVLLRHMTTRMGQAALLTLSILTISASALLPSTRDAAVLYVVPRLANSEMASERIPADLRELYDKGVLLLKDRLSAELGAKKEARP